MMLALIILRNARAIEANFCRRVADSVRQRPNVIERILPLQAAEDSDVNRGLAS